MSALRPMTFLGIAMLVGMSACGGAPAHPTTSDVRPSILLITLDTTRADAIGPEATGIATPAFNALTLRGRRFRQAYAAVPETLPSHTSIMSGLYPAAHGVCLLIRAGAPLRPRPWIRCV